LHHGRTEKYFGVVPQYLMPLRLVQEEGLSHDLAGRTLT
jgi:hypothetical protein